jgi:hypothetical protein
MYNFEIPYACWYITYHFRYVELISERCSIAFRVLVIADSFFKNSFLI